MSGEIISILAVGVALVGVILTSSRVLWEDMARMGGRIVARKPLQIRRKMLTTHSWTDRCSGVLGPNFRRSVLGAVLAMILTTGCGGREGFRDPVLKFHEASSVVIASARLYLTELNKVERDSYIQEKASKLDQINLIEMKEARVFSAEGLKARLDSLSQLASYGELLWKLANDDIPERISAQSTSLKDSLEGLAGTLKLLDQNVSQEEQDQHIRFKSAVGLFTTILGEILEAVADNKLKQALKMAVDQGEKPVNDLLLAIERDIEIAYERRRSKLSALRVIRVDAYNNEIDSTLIVIAKRPNSLLI